MVGELSLKGWVILGNLYWYSSLWYWLGDYLFVIKLLLRMKDKKKTRKKFHPIFINNCQIHFIFIWIKIFESMCLKNHKVVSSQTKSLPLEYFFVLRILLYTSYYQIFSLALYNLHFADKCSCCFWNMVFKGFLSLALHCIHCIEFADDKMVLE